MANINSESVVTLYTDINGIELNQERESFVGTLTNIGQGYKVQVLKEYVTFLDNDLVEIKENALLISCEECPEEEFEL